MYNSKKKLRSSVSKVGGKGGGGSTFFFQKSETQKSRISERKITFIII